MATLEPFFESEFNTQREQWEKALLSELKINEVGSKAARKLLSGISFPTLSLEAKSEISLSTDLSWKKASVTYAKLPQNLRAAIEDDLNCGVRNFFFHKDSLNSESWNTVATTLENFVDAKDLEVFIPGGHYSSSKINVITNLISGSLSHDQGGHCVQELGELAFNLIQNSSQDVFYIGVYVDSMFFQNIAKIRAARMLAMKIFEEENIKKKMRIVALTSFQGWSLYERYSNMLRNETAVASALIGGADHVQSSGYNSIIELEAENVKEDEHFERSRRMARNTSHVLALESLLGIVSDASYGSFHLENLTNSFCEESWTIMQRLLRGENLSDEIKKVSLEKELRIMTRKSVVSGINDYPDMKETLDFSLKQPTYFRQARKFEELRLQMENVKKPEVYIALFGDYAALNARLNFVKNYFELLGLKVTDPGHSVTTIEDFKKNLLSCQEEIVAFCAADDQYSLIQDTAKLLSSKNQFVAGKVGIPGMKNLFAGQNIYEILQNLVEEFTGRSA